MCNIRNIGVVSRFLVLLRFISFLIIKWNCVGVDPTWRPHPMSKKRKLDQPATDIFVFVFFFEEILYYLRQLTICKERMMFVCLTRVIRKMLTMVSNLCHTTSFPINTKSRSLSTHPITILSGIHLRSPNKKQLPTSGIDPSSS